MIKKNNTTIKKEILKVMPKKRLLKARQMQVIALRDSKDKTVLVTFSILKIHSLYKKRYFSTRKLLAATDIEIVKGQKILIEECRPVSKRKAWKVVEVIK